MMRPASSVQCPLVYPVLAWLALCLLSTAQAQPSLAEFRAAWSQMPPDTAKVKYLYAYIKGNYDLPGDSLFGLAAEGYNLAEQLGDGEGQILMRLHQGFGKMELGNPALATPYFEDAARLSEQIADTFLWARSITNIGLVQQNLGHEDQALTHYQRAAELFDQVGKPSASLFNNLAIIYRKQGEHQEAIHWYQRSLSLKRAAGDSTGVATTYMNLALLHGKEGDSLASFAAGHRALQIFESEGPQAYLAWARLAMGNLSFDFENSTQAMHYLGLALNYYREHQESPYYYHVLYGLGEVATARKNWYRAETYFRQALNIARKGQKMEDIQGILKNLSETLYEQGKARQAYPLIVESLQLKDTLTQRTRLALEKEMLARFEVDQQESQLKIQDLELARKTLNQRVAWGLVGISFLAILGVLYFLWQKNRTTQLLRRQNVLIEKSLEEKEALMREIHHRVKNNLQFVSSLLRLHTRQVQDMQAYDALVSSQNLVHSMALIHQHLYQGKHQTGIHIDSYLHRLVSELVNAFKPASLKLDWEVHIQPLILNIDLALSIGLMVNELVCNALKYAFTDRDTGSLVVKLSAREARLTLQIIDDGPGMKHSSMTDTSSHFGYQLIQLLTEQLEGTLTIHSASGLSVSLDLPYEATRV